MAASNSPAEQLITENIDIWTSAIKKRGSQGRGSSKKIELYGIKKLRELILELAVRGLLVPQDPNDEPASVLLEKIAAEKEQLIKDGKIKKQKALPEISKDEKPFELPNGWEWSRVAFMGIGSTGKTPKTSMTECFNGNIPFIGPGQITPLGKLLDSDKTLTEVGLGYSTEANIGDILMVCIGGSIGKASIADKRISFNQQINALQPLIASSGYLYIAMTANFFYQSVLASSTGSATPIINRMKWEELLVPLPPEAEQPRIVAKVDELMALCDQLEQQTESSLTAHQTLVETLLNTLLNADQNSFDPAWERIAQHFDVLFTTEHSIDQLKQTILQLAVMGKLTFPCSDDTSVLNLIEKIYEERILYKNNSKEKEILEREFERASASIIKNRAEVKARFFCNFITKGTTPAKNELLEEEEIPFLKVYNIVNQKLDFNYKPTFISPDTHNKKLARSKAFPGDVIMNIVGPPLGKVAIITSQFPEWNMNQALAVYRPVGGVLSKYLYYTLSARVTLESVLKEVKGTAGQDNLSLEQCRELIITLPSIEEQNRIVAKLEELMAICDTLKKHISETEATQLHLADAMAE